jgi:hypothetical protein
MILMSEPSRVCAIYQQNTQAAKTTPVVASRTRTINASFMIRLR